QSNLASVFATAPDASLRNGTRAVELAGRALKLADDVSPILHRTLAAAYAEAGRFDDAIATAERGHALAEREGNRELADEFTAVLPIPTAPILPRRQPATARRLITRSACEQELEGRAPRARVAQPSWLWANGHRACCAEPYGDQSRGGLANPSTELPCNFGERPNVEIYIMSLLASFMNLAGPDLIVILLIVLVLFGAKKLPELARGMGQAVREF